VDFRQGFTISLASSIINYVASEATTRKYLLLDFASQISEKSKFQFGRWLTAEKSLNSNGKWKAHKYNFKLISLLVIQSQDVAVASSVKSVRFMRRL
jgi:hypothetical protein